MNQTLTLSAGVFFIISMLTGSVYAQPTSATGALKPFSRPPAPATAPAITVKSPLGRVFFTPSERQALDDGQPLNLDEGDEKKNSDTSLGSARSWVLDGYVQRNGRLEAVWVNGRIPAVDSEFTVIRSARNADGMTVLDAQKKPVVEGLKAGQKANIDKREVLDPLPQGAIIKRTSR